MTAKETSPDTQPHPHQLQGWAVDSGDAPALVAALEQALDYRGDVTITRTSSPAPIEGYIFDLKGRGSGLIIRLIPRNSDERIAIALHDVARLEFTGKDTASGKSFETWVKKYVEKKLAGEKASIESEPLESE